MISKCGRGGGWNPILTGEKCNEAVNTPINFKYPLKDDLLIIMTENYRNYFCLPTPSLFSVKTWLITNFIPRSFIDIFLLTSFPRYHLKNVSEVSVHISLFCFLLIYVCVLWQVPLWFKRYLLINKPRWPRLLVPYIFIGLSIVFLNMIVFFHHFFIDFYKGSLKRFFELMFFG